MHTSKLLTKARLICSSPADRASCTAPWPSALSTRGDPVSQCSSVNSKSRWPLVRGAGLLAALANRCFNPTIARVVIGWVLQVLPCNLVVSSPRTALRLRPCHTVSYTVRCHVHTGSCAISLSLHHKRSFAFASGWSSVREHCTVRFDAVFRRACERL